MQSQMRTRRVWEAARCDRGCKASGGESDAWRAIASSRWQIFVTSTGVEPLYSLAGLLVLPESQRAYPL